MSKVRAALKGFHSPDVDLESYSPAEPGCFMFLLQVFFGPEDRGVENSFDVIVCTPAWLECEVGRRGILDGRHHLIVEKFDLDTIRAFLTEYAENATGDSWDEVAARLSRLGRWEFEDYQPFVDPS